MSVRCALLLLAVWAASGCSHLAHAPDAAASGGEVECRALYAEVDRTVHRAGVEDGEAGRIEGYPYLRVDRVLASFSGETLSDEQFAQWLDRLGALDRTARRAELANLPVPEQDRLRAAYGGDVVRALDRCRTTLSAIDLHSTAGRERLRSRAYVEDDYDTWKRIVGLYWITRLPFASGVKGYQDEVSGMFQTPLERLPVRGRLAAYTPPAGVPLTPDAVRDILTRAASNPLGIPEPGPEDLEALFRTFAPRWVVDERDGNDRIGRLVLDARGKAEIDASSPAVYRRAAHTRVGEATLLQLVYSVWLPARPKTSTFDLLGGHLDGIVWRVTLAPDGTPLVFDSIHNCGCYHQFFPTPRAHPLPQPDSLDEWAFIPQRLDAVVPGDPVALRIESGTHYLQRVSVGTGDGAGTTYEYAADDGLRSLPHPEGGNRSAFQPDGIVAGSERRERYVFWPMGVADPGAMRQWGRHATAFIGRRHFDEARLMERYFRLDLR